MQTFQELCQNMGDEIPDGIIASENFLGALSAWVEPIAAHFVNKAPGFDRDFLLEEGLVKACAVIKENRYKPSVLPRLLAKSIKRHILDLKKSQKNREKHETRFASENYRLTSAQDDFTTPKPEAHVILDVIASKLRHQDLQLFLMVRAGMRRKRIAEELGVAEGTAYGKIHRMIKRIRKVI